MIIKCNYINHLNKHTIAGIKFGGIMPQNFKMALVNASSHDVAAHHGLFPLRCVYLLPANTKCCTQLHLLTTESVFDAALAEIFSIDAIDWNIIT